MKIAVLFVALAVPVPVIAQTAPAPAATAPAAAPAPVIAVGSRVGDVPTGYDDGGRRDPFASLVTPKRLGPTADGRPKTGIASLSVSDVVVKGIVKSGDTMLAILEIPGKQSFVARVKDRLFDATVQSIDSGGVVFAEHVGSAAPTQVRKALRSTGEEGR